MNAQSYCLNLLKRRLRSERELREAMGRKEVEAAEQDSVIGVLKELGLVDDLRFARSWVHTRDRLAPRGAFVLRQELAQKGIAADLISQVLAERSEQARTQDDQPTEEDLARRLVEGRGRLYANLAPEVRERRLMAMLQRRGFSYDVIRHILDT